MTRWFRFHADAMRNPKVAKLTDREFRLWMRLLCVASENDGVIPRLEDLKSVLNARLDHLLAGVERLISVGLIDRKGDGYEPHNWGKFQYKSDSSTERVRKHRAERNVSETPPDTETDTEDKTVEANASTGADAPLTVSKSMNPEAELFALGRKVLGKSAGGLVTKLRKATGFDDGQVKALIEQAAEKSNPAEWIVGVLRRHDSEKFGVPVRGSPFPKLETAEDRAWRETERRIYAGAL